MEKTLGTIQKLAKVGKVLSKVVFIICIVAGSLITVGGILYAVAGDVVMRIGGITIYNLIRDEVSVEIGPVTVAVAMAVGVIACAAEAVLARFAELYFRRELEDGTPFTLRGAAELKRLGILAIAIPAGTSLLASIVRTVIEAVMAGASSWHIGFRVSLGMGIMLLILSLFCRYGAERQDWAHGAGQGTWNYSGQGQAQGWYGQNYYGGQGPAQGTGSAWDSRDKKSGY